MAVASLTLILTSVVVVMPLEQKAMVAVVEPAFKPLTTSLPFFTVAVAISASAMLLTVFTIAAWKLSASVQW